MEDDETVGYGASQLSARPGERPANRQGTKRQRMQNRLEEDQNDDAYDDLSRPSSRGDEAVGTANGRRRAKQRLGEKHRRTRQGEDGETLDEPASTDESHPVWGGDSPRRAGQTNPRRANRRAAEERQRQAPQHAPAAATHRAGGNSAKMKADLLGGVDDSRRELSAAGDRSARQPRGREADRATVDDTASRKASARSTRSGKKEKEEQIYGSLTERANRVVAAPDYMQRLSDIKQGKTGSRYMDFIMDGVKIGVPYNGLKVTNGYLKKETQSKGILMSRSWQLKYCVLDLSRFEFKYAKNPTQEFTRIQLKGIIDVFIEDDPARKDGDKSIFSLGRTDKSLDGFNFQIQTPQRIFRMQASTKVEQTMWIRAFAVLFELRARVLAQFNSRTLETINSRRESEQVYSPLSQYSSKLMSQRKQQSNRQKEQEKQESLSNTKGRYSTRNSNNNTIELTNKQQENTKRRYATHQRSKQAEEAKEEEKRDHRDGMELDDRIDQLRHDNFGRPSLPDEFETLEAGPRSSKPPMTTKAANQCMTQRNLQINTAKQPVDDVLGDPAKLAQKSATTTRNNNQNIKFYDPAPGSQESGKRIDTMNMASAYRTNQPMSTSQRGELVQLDDLSDKQAEIISPGKAKKHPESLNTARQAEELKRKKLELQKKLTALQLSKEMMESTLTGMRSVRAAASKQLGSAADAVPCPPVDKDQKAQKPGNANQNIEGADTVRQETEYEYEYDDEYDEEYDAEVERSGSRLTQHKKGSGRHSKMSKKSSTKHTPSMRADSKLTPLNASIEEQRPAKKSPDARDLAIEDVWVPDVAKKRYPVPTAHLKSTKDEDLKDAAILKRDNEQRHQNDKEKDREKQTSSKTHQRADADDERNSERNKRQQLSFEQQPVDFQKLHQFQKGFLSNNVKPTGRRNQPDEDDETQVQQVPSKSLRQGVDPELQQTQSQRARPTPSTRYSAAGENQEMRNLKLKVKLSQGMLQRLSQERSKRQLGGLLQATERQQLRNSGNQHALQLLRWAAKNQVELQPTLLSARAPGPNENSKDEERINPLQQPGLSRQNSQAPSNASFGATSRAKVKLKTFRLSNQNGHWLTSAKKAGKEADYQSTQHNEYSNGNHDDIACSSTMVEKFQVDQDMFRSSANKDQDGHCELGANIWSKTLKDARTSTDGRLRNSEPGLGFGSTRNPQKTQNQQPKGHLNFYASTGGANGAQARPYGPSSPTTKSTLTKEKSSSIASLKLEKHKSKRAYKLPIKAASLRRVKANAGAAGRVSGAGLSSARQQTIPLQSKNKESKGVRGAAIPTILGKDQQLEELKDEVSANTGPQQAPAAGVSEIFINNLMSQSSVSNRVKGLNINGPNAAESSQTSKPTQLEGKREGRFEPPVLPAAGCLDTDLGFVDLLNRESDSCFVERIGKQEKIKQRASACSERSRCSGLGSRSSSLAEKDVRERQNSRKRNLLESQGSQLRLHGAHKDGRNAPLKDPFEYFGDHSQKTRKQQILIPKRTSLEEQKSPATAGTPQERVYANFQQRQQLNFSNISRISGDLHQSTLDSRQEGLVSFDHAVRPHSRPQQHQAHAPSSHSTNALPAAQPIIQNIRIDQSTNNVFNFYNYSNNGDLNSQANQSKQASATPSPIKEASKTKSTKETGRTKAKAAGKAAKVQQHVEVIEDILEDW